jgi:RNA polymerase sigma factor (sigma-70 family)
MSVDPNDHMGLLYWEAAQMARTYGRPVSELVGSGYLGLARAARRFDPSLGLAFATFAVPHIRGAILDGLRAEQPRGKRYGRRAHISLESLLTLPPAAMPPRLADALTTNPDYGAAVDRERRASRVRRAVDALKPRPRAAIHAHFWGDGPSALAARWGCTIANISHMKRRALARLARMLAPLAPEGA